MNFDFVKELIETKTNKEHFLKKAKEELLPYYTGFIAQLPVLRGNLTEKQFNNLLHTKLQIGKAVFDRDQYIQYACEATVIAYFSQRASQNFKYEYNANPSNKTNVDCSFSENCYRYNIEVKSAIYKHDIPKIENPKFDFVDRADNYSEVKHDLNDRFKDIPISKRKDNNLKDYLIAANNKFNTLDNEDEINILNVCCGDINDIQKWYHYMYLGGGLFSESPFDCPNNYNLVDLVILNNLAYKHTLYSEKEIQDHWLYDKSFSLVFPNPYAKVRKDKGINYFIENTTNYNKLFGVFLASRKVTLIVEFINDFLMQNGYTPYNT